MNTETDIREFVLNALKEMNYDVSDVTGDTDLGPAGLDLESLAVAELAVLVEDHRGGRSRGGGPGGRVERMSQPATPDRPVLPNRAVVVEMLASFGQRSVDEVPEQIGSLELTWLITKVELQYGVTLELSDETLMSMTTVTSAVTGLRDGLPGAEHV